MRRSAHALAQDLSLSAFISHANRHLMRQTGPHGLQTNLRDSSVGVGGFQQWGNSRKSGMWHVARGMWAEPVRWKRRVVRGLRRVEGRGSSRQFPQTTSHLLRAAHAYRHAARSSQCAVRGSRFVVRSAKCAVRGAWFAVHGPWSEADSVGLSGSSGRQSMRRYGAGSVVCGKLLASESRRRSLSQIASSIASSTSWTDTWMAPS